MELPTQLDRLEVIVVVDNSVDVSDPQRQDVFTPQKWTDRKTARIDRLLAGHGLSLLLCAKSGTTTRRVLYDTGPSAQLFKNNVDALGLDLSDIDALVISHGHGDHLGGIPAMLKLVRRRPLPVYIHPRTLERKAIVVKDRDGEHMRDANSATTSSSLKAAGVNLMIASTPVPVADRLFMTTGQILRTTSYETGFSGHKIRIDGKWVDDQPVTEDMALFARVRGKGIVVVSGCSHAGIANIVLHVRSLTGNEPISAIVGGLHLTGANRSLAEQTARQLKTIRPGLIAPCHCTSWTARFVLHEAMPEAYTPVGVGTKIVIEA